MIENTDPLQARRKSYKSDTCCFFFSGTVDPFEGLGESVKPLRH